LVECQWSPEEKARRIVARIKAENADYEREEARAHEMTFEYARQAMAGMPPEWLTGGDNGPRMLEMPQYYDVSPAWTPVELQEAMMQREVEDARR
jgi:hypothetical protein